jgi:Fic-DOC domain mobile mystery protein B
VKLQYPPGATPLDPDEAAGLIPVHVTLQRQLDEYEAANILQAAEWLNARRRGDPLDDRFVHEVHRRMFDQTWTWAGQSRQSDKTIGVPWFNIAVSLRNLLDDVRTQLAYSTYSPFEIAVRFHHRLVAIHVFPNGNGRHARIMADLLFHSLSGQRLEWGRDALNVDGDARARYLSALRAADAGDLGPLLQFVTVER